MNEKQWPLFCFLLSREEKPKNHVHDHVLVLPFRKEERKLKILAFEKDGELDVVCCKYNGKTQMQLFFFENFFCKGFLIPFSI